MKRFLTAAAVLIFLCFNFVLAAEKPHPAPSRPPRIPEMSAAGTVLEISGTILKIERSLKGKAEMMEFILEKPFPNIAAGDPVKVRYQEKEGRNVLIQVTPAKKTAVKKAVRKDLPKGMKPVTPSPAPAAK